MTGHDQILRRVGAVLLVFCGLHLIWALGDLALDSWHSFLVDLVALVLGVMLLNGNLRAARWATFWTSVDLGLLGLALFGLPLAMSFSATVRELAGGTVNLSWTFGTIVAELAASAWIVRELRRPVVEEALERAAHGSNRSAMGWGLTAVALLTAAAALAAIPLHHRWQRMSPSVIAAAQAQYGSDWQYTVTGLSRSDGRWRARLVARRGQETMEIEVDDVAQ